MAEEDLRKALVGVLRILAGMEHLQLENQAMAFALRAVVTRDSPDREDEYNRIFLQQMNGALALETDERIKGMLVLAKKLENLYG